MDEKEMNFFKDKIDQLETEIKISMIFLLIFFTLNVFALYILIKKIDHIDQYNKIEVKK